MLEHALKEARQAAHHDALTGLSSRRLLEDRYKQAKARSDRQGRQMAVLFLDIDGFKRVNDAHGHAAGDSLLRQMAARLVACVRTSDTVCRYGGDEFVIFLPEGEGGAGAISAARKVRERLFAPYFIGASSIQLHASIGIAVYPADGTELGALIEKADSAMYREKSSKLDERYSRPQNHTDPDRRTVHRQVALLEGTRTPEEPEPRVRRALARDAPAT